MLCEEGLVHATLGLHAIVRVVSTCVVSGLAALSKIESKTWTFHNVIPVLVGLHKTENADGVNC